MARRSAFGRFCRDEAGSGSVLPMFILVGMLVGAGFSIDTGNLWHNGEVMRATADVAAHAGAVALSRGNDASDAVAAAELAIGWNMDPEIFDAEPGKPRSHLARAWHYDAQSGQLSDEGAANAVSVQIRRGPQDGNALPMYLLHLFGLPEWETSATAVVALTPTERCSNAGGLFARDVLTTEGETEIGAGFCLHSQSNIDMARPVKFEDGARLSLPDLAACGPACREPGLRDMAGEDNFITRPLRDQIGHIAEAMMLPLADAPEKAAFFADRPMTEDLEPLAEIEVDTTGLVTGSVVRMAVADFEVLREVPQGLVYAVVCDLTSLEPPVLVIRGGMNGPVVNDVALVTNCALHFEDDVEVMGSLMVSTYAGALPSITADPWAMLGDPSATCDATAATQLMALGDLEVPAGLILSNVAMVQDGNVTLLGGDGGALAQHHGFALHASGKVDLRGHHSFAACDQASLETLPSLQVLRYVMPKIEAAPRVMQPRTIMPGEAAKPLPRTPALPMSRVPPTEQMMSQAAGPEAKVGL